MIRFVFSTPVVGYFSLAFADISDIERVARALEPKLKRAFLQAVAGMGEQVAIGRLEQALLIGDIESAIALLAFKELEEALSASLKPLMLEALGEGGEAALKALPSAARTSLRFDLVNPRAVEWIERHAGEMIKGIADESRLAIRALIRRGFSDGITPRESARAIKAHIGLNRQQSAALANYERGLTEKGFKPVRIDDLVEKYRNRLLGQRADLISTQESLTASHEGQRELWRQGLEKGLIDPTRTQKKWLMSPSPCPKICAPMRGQRVGVDSQFVTGRGAAIDGPPAHVKCRCSEGLVFN